MITKIKWDNHNVLGNLELDLTKHDGSAYNTIILAGENGTGKTTILKTLAGLSEMDSFNFAFIDYEINGTAYTMTTENKADVQISYYHERNNNNGIAQTITTDTRNYAVLLNTASVDFRRLGCAYSKARSGFKTGKVRSTTTQQLDAHKYIDDSDDDFTPIKQLLVDIDAQDNSQWMQITKNGIGTPYEEFRTSSKMSRFETAFNSFFDNMAFKQVDTTARDEIRILFEKHGKSISIDDLSTGEKQIVFRGAHLLKNINSITGGMALIDEPELSMHPKWQQKVLAYYRNLFTNSGIQSVQTIFATHSEYVLRAALQDKENVLIIVLYDDNGTIIPRRITAPTILPAVTAAETNYLAFNVISTDYHIELYGYLQTKTGCYSIKQCDDYIANQRQYNPSLHRKPSSHIHSNGRTTNYQTLPTYIRNQIDHPNQHSGFTDNELKQSIELLIELCK